MPDMVYAKRDGEIVAEPGLETCGMKGGRFFRLSRTELVKLPEGARLFKLPDRRAVGFDSSSGRFVSSEATAAAAFMPPGYTVTHSPAYIESGRPEELPLFSYAAVAGIGGALFAAAIRVDRDIRHDSGRIDMMAVRSNIRRFKRSLSGNRLVRQLETCATEYGCPNAQNFFLGRFECPLPTSPSCNASCAGCISLADKMRRGGQCRINFIPTPEEVCEIALSHIERVKDPIVSFGQGCEGEPLLRAKLIERSISMIRRATPRGLIHMNTNGSSPEALKKLMSAGLGSVRISMNSFRKSYYTKYYRPRGYSFEDVLGSVAVAGRMGAFVSINYLTMPGFTDSKEEVASLGSVLVKNKIDMIQWRNLNYDPLRYFAALGANVERKDMVGIKEEMVMLRREFPKLRMGYFNPSRLQSSRKS